MKSFTSEERLPADILEKVQELWREGTALAENDNFSLALDKYWEAWDRLPQPPEQWPIAAVLLSSIAQTNYLTGDFATARENFETCLQCPDNGYGALWCLRLGQCCYELGDFEAAAVAFDLAYQNGGAEVFATEDEKYLEFLRSRRT